MRKAAFCLQLLWSIFLLQGCAPWLSKYDMQVQEQALRHPWLEYLNSYRKQPIRVDYEYVPRWPIVHLDFHWSEFGPTNAKAPQSQEPTIVLLHGTPGNQATMVPLLMQANSLAANFRVITVDRLWHGRTSGSAQYDSYVQGIARTFEVEVTTLKLFLERVPNPPKKVILIGHSYGGVVAWKFAQRYPEMMSHLVLMNSFGIKRPKEEFTSAERKLLSWEAIVGGNPGMGRFGLSKEEVRKSLLEMSYDEKTAELATDIYYLASVGAGNMEAAVSLTYEEADFDSSRTIKGFSQIQCPVLLIWGEDDPTSSVSRQACGVFHALPNWPSGFVIRGTGHSPHEQRPQLVNSIINYWLGIETNSPKNEWFVAGTCEQDRDDSLGEGYYKTTWVPKE